jgi:hypothetical protein
MKTIAATLCKSNHERINDTLTATPVDSNPRKSGDPENIQVDTNTFALVRISHVEKLHDCNF